MFRPIWPTSGVKILDGGNCCYFMRPFFYVHVSCADVLLSVVPSCSLHFLMPIAGEIMLVYLSIGPHIFFLTAKWIYIK
jgi:hypothetical protein